MQSYLFEWRFMQTYNTKIEFSKVATLGTISTLHLNPGSYTRKSHVGCILMTNLPVFSIHNIL